MENELDEIKRRVLDNENRISTLQADLKANAEVTKAIKEDTQDLMTVVHTLSGLAKFMTWFANFLWWLAPIAAVAVSAWAYLHGKKDL